MGTFLIINSPPLFSTIWCFIKPWLDESTLRKIRILGKNYHAELARFVDLDDLPKELGGKCDCRVSYGDGYPDEARGEAQGTGVRGVGRCRTSDKGPWNPPSLRSPCSSTSLTSTTPSATQSQSDLSLNPSLNPGSTGLSTLGSSVSVSVTCEKDLAGLTLNGDSSSTLLSVSGTGAGSGSELEVASIREKGDGSPLTPVVSAVDV